MTRPTRRGAKKIATIWPIIGTDQFTGITYGTPFTEKVNFEKGSTKQYSDSQGNVFIPKSIYWYELTVNGVPALNSPIALGDNTAQADPTNVTGIEFVRVGKLQDGGKQTDDVMVLT